MTPHREPEAHLPLPNLAFHVLLALGAGALHGYGIILDIEERTDGKLGVRSGTLYATLQRLQEEGLVEDAPFPDEPDTDRRRKYYRMTPFGRRVAAAESERLAGLLAVARERKLAPETP